MNRARRRQVMALSYLAMIASLSNDKASGFPSDNAYRHKRTRDKIARASRKRNRVA
jgi:hypothetical protein